MRGEQALSANLERTISGSPPHARGAGVAYCSGGSSGGITPACAGSRKLPACPPGSPRDHPRMRGEQQRKLGRRNADLGSPPHARGAVHHVAAAMAMAGITPACAGSRPSCGQQRPGWRDHPRMRGEQVEDAPIGTILPGSPPHARGAVAHEGGDEPQLGITPACAGSR